MEKSYWIVKLVQRPFVTQMKMIHRCWLGWNPLLHRHTQIADIVFALAKLILAHWWTLLTRNMIGKNTNFYSALPFSCSQSLFILFLFFPTIQAAFHLNKLKCTWWHKQIIKQSQCITNRIKQFHSLADDQRSINWKQWKIHVQLWIQMHFNKQLRKCVGKGAMIIIITRKTATQNIQVLMRPKPYLE